MEVVSAVSVERNNGFESNLISKPEASVHVAKIDSVDKHNKISNKKLFQCKECLKSFIWECRLVAHKRLHTGEQPYECETCNKRFSLKESLRTHKKFVHTSERPFKCGVCNKGYKSNHKLESHKRIHTDERPYECEICRKRFAQNILLIRHNERVHIADRPFECEICNKTFKENSKLKVHKRIHTGEKPYGCDICNKRYTDNRSLAEHKRIHTGEKPYECGVCYMRFSYSSGFRHHKKTHTGEKPYGCDICNKRFTSNTSLKNHKIIHTGEKPYGCDICNRRFTSNTALKDHKIIHTVNRSLTEHIQRIHTGKKPYECDVCSKQFRRKAQLYYHKRIGKCNICGNSFCHKNVKSMCNKCTNISSETELGSKEKLLNGLIVPRSAMLINREAVIDTVQNEAKVGPIEPSVEVVPIVTIPPCPKSRNIVHALCDQSVNSNEEEQVQCIECGKQFKDGYSLQVHMMTHSIFAIAV